MIREHLMWTVGLVACSGPEDASTTEETQTSEAIDLLARAYGGCTATLSKERDGSPDGGGEHDYDENGDLVEVSWRGEPRSTSSWEYDRPHEAARYEVDFEDRDLDDFAWTYDWRDGRMTELRFDGGIDGTVDWIERRSYDERGLMVLDEWDYDGDEVFDDTLDLVWSADGEGWYATGEGVDPYGTYAVEFWADATSEPYGYTYVDDRGLSGDWEAVGRNPLGHWARVEAREAQQGEYTLEEIEALSFDERDRISDKTYTTDRAEAGGAQSRTVEVYTYAYDCP